MISRNGKKKSYIFWKSNSQIWSLFIPKIRYDQRMQFGTLSNSFFTLQIMTCIGIAFVFSVLTFFSFYRYILQQNEFFRESSFVHLERCVFFGSFMLMVVFSGSLIGHEVNKNKEYSIYRQY